MVIQGYLDVSKDPVSWMVSQLSGAILLSDNVTVASVSGVWVQKLTDIPWVSVYHKAKRGEWVQLGAGRRQWNTTLGVRTWSKTMIDRDAMYRSIKSRVSDAAKAYSASGFIWCHVTDARPMDEPERVPPLYSSDVSVEVIYHETLSYS